MSKSALITGITGQDGSYLSELLLQNGYVVHGILRRSSSFNTARIEHIYRDPHEQDRRLFLHYGDLSDGNSLRRILAKASPDEVYNLGAQSHVKVSFEVPEDTADSVAGGTLRMLEAVREFVAETGRSVRFYQAGSSEMFGTAAAPQSEQTAFAPRSPYAIAKAAAHWYAVTYRDAYGLFVSNGILFNHESPRRGETFVTRKITRAVGRIKHGLQSKLYLGNLEAKRDWGYAADYVCAMWQMLQLESADDFVIATGESHSVAEFAQAAFQCAGLDWRNYVEVDPAYFRATEVPLLQGDSGKAKRAFGWEPATGFHDLVRLMVEHDLALAAAERAEKESGLEWSTKAASS